MSPSTARAGDQRHMNKSREPRPAARMIAFIFVMLARFGSSPGRRRRGASAEEPAQLLGVPSPLVAADGRVPAAPARKLLPLEEGQIVVVRGQAEVNSLGVLVVRATGLSIRR